MVKSIRVRMENEVNNIVGYSPSEEVEVCQVVLRGENERQTPKKLRYILWTTFKGP